MGLQVACMHHEGDSKRREKVKNKNKHKISFQMLKNAVIRVYIFLFNFSALSECYKFMSYTIIFGPKTIDYQAKTYNGWPYKGMLLHGCADTECRNHASMVLPRHTPSPSRLPLMKYDHHRLNITYKVCHTKFRNA